MALKTYIQILVSSRNLAELNICALIQVQNLQNFFLEKKYIWSQAIQSMEHVAFHKDNKEL